MRRGGVLPRPMRRTSCYAPVGRHPCVPPPTTAAPLTAGYMAPPYRYFTDFVGVGVPDDPPARTSKLCVGRGDPVAVPKIFALPYGGRLKF